MQHYEAAPSNSSSVNARRTIYHRISAGRNSAQHARQDETAMGIENRDYYRDDTPTGSHTGQHTMITKIIVATAAIFVLNMFIAGRDSWIMYGMASGAADLWTPLYWWRFLTAGFAHDPESIMHILFNMFGLFMLGRSVEEAYGPKEFLRFYLVTIVLGSLAQAGIAYAWNPQGPWPRCLGASGALTGVVVLFICNFPKQTLLFLFVIPMPAWVFGLIFIGINLLGVGGVYLPIDGDFESASRVAYDVHLVGAAFGAAYFYFGWNLGRLLPGGGLSLRALKPKPKLRVHDPGVDYEEKDLKADALLDKVKRNGMDSLTSRERKILEDYSRRMQQKHR